MINLFVFYIIFGLTFYVISTYYLSKFFRQNRSEMLKEYFSYQNLSMIILWPIGLLSLLICFLLLYFLDQDTRNNFFNSNRS